MKIKGKDFEINLIKKPKENSIIIEGFPGLGFVSSIVTNYLIHHLPAKFIGYISTKKLAPLVTIHQTKIIYPIEIFYNEDYNIIIIQSSTLIEGVEYDIAEIILEFAKAIKAKEIITIEAVVSTKPEEKIFFFTNNKKKEKILKEKGFEEIKEGIIVGVTGALLIESEKFPLIGLFVETNPEIIDNRASAKIIEALDKYIGLKIDYAPLLKKAEEIEEKIKNLIEKIIETKKEKEKRISYAG
ncbi:MAG: PAC2 family protein [Candidatus Pacearchaeota archaeon]